MLSCVVVGKWQDKTAVIVPCIKILPKEMWNITSDTFAVVNNERNHFIYTMQEPQLQFAVRDFTTAVVFTSTFLATDWGILHHCYEPV